MKRCVVLFVVILGFVSLRSAMACTDPIRVSAKVVKHSDDDVVAYEYYHPSRMLDRKKPQRAISVVADSILSVARDNFNRSVSITHNEVPTKKPDEAVKINMESDMANYRYKADAITNRTRHWADSICSLFRRPTFETESEFQPR